MVKYFVVDAFAEKPFEGNPAAVVLLENGIPDELKQQIASELNLSETAFLLISNGILNLGWFSPTVEVDLCGHATLATAHILWERGLLSADSEAVFETKSGILKARKNGKFVEMDFPREDPIELSCPKSLTEAIKELPIYVGKNRFDYIAVYEGEEIIRSLHPNFELLKELDSRGLIVTSASDSDKFDFVSRFFAPNAGINEDSVTGSAHCCLAPYWSEIIGKRELVGCQVSKRGGVVNTKLYGDKVVLSGTAVTVIEGDFYLDF